MSLATPQEIVDGLRDWGLIVHERPGWRTRGQHRPFDPYGQAIHHDAFREDYSDLAAVEFMERGRPDLPPYLCNGTIGEQGGIYLVCYGNANHAGRNEADVHARLKAGLAPLGDARLDPDGDTVIGNPHLWGWECRNAGTGHDVWEQLEVMERTCAAMSDINGWSTSSIAGHRELTARKVDPVGFDMHAFRADVTRYYIGGSDAVPLTKGEIEQIAKRTSAVLRADILNELRAVTKATDKRVVGIGRKVDADTDVDEAEIAKAVIAGLDPEAIGAAIAAERSKADAEMIADVIAERLAG